MSQGPVGLIYHILLQHGIQVCSVRALEDGLEITTPTGLIRLDNAAQEFVIEGNTITLDTHLDIRYLSGFSVSIMRNIIRLRA